MLGIGDLSLGGNVLTILRLSCLSYLALNILNELFEASLIAMFSYLSTISCALVLYLAEAVSLHSLSCFITLFLHFLFNDLDAISSRLCLNYQATIKPP